MSVESRIKYNKAVFTYKAINNMTPDYITELLTPMSQTHSLNLRSGETGALYVPFFTLSSISWFFFMLSSKIMELIVSGSPKFRVFKCCQNKCKVIVLRLNK